MANPPNNSNSSNKPVTPSPAPAAPTMSISKDELLNAIREGIAMGNALATQKPAAAPDPFPRGQMCQECRQDKSACKGKHRQVVLWCQNPLNQKWFTGLTLNGVRYISSHPGHKVTIPEDFAAEEMMTNYERNEDHTRTGQVVEHNSGFISPNGGGNVRSFNGPGFGAR